jgi:hypothetical protein
VFAQLEPIVKDPTNGVWAYEAEVWSELNPVVLKEVVRQKNQKFVELLNRGRVGESTLSDMRFLWDKRQWRSASVPARFVLAHCVATREWMFEWERDVPSGTKDTLPVPCADCTSCRAGPTAKESTMSSS